MPVNLDSFQPDRFYHVFNRTNNKEQLFKQPRNYVYFLNKYDKYLSSYLSTYAYCLLGNHFHLLVKVHSEEILQKLIEGDKVFDCHKMVSKQFATFFGTYSKAINKQEGRYGSLFQRPFKRLEVKSETHFSHLVYYIHANPVLHKTVTDFKRYKWSSYKTLISKSDTRLARQEVLDWFGGHQEFIDFHDVNHEDYRDTLDIG